jgi:hypothetical protein
MGSSLSGRLSRIVQERCKAAFPHYEHKEADMQPLLDRILAINLVLSTIVFYVGARIYILPKVKELKPRTILLPSSSCTPSGTSG